MVKGLCRASLWQRGDGAFNAADILVAWQVMSRLGLPYRVCASGASGEWECRVADPRLGGDLAVARGDSCGEAMCRAALSASGAADAG